MSKFRKKPVVIEAYQFLSETSEATTAYPSWFIAALRDEVIKCIDGDWYVQTLENGKLAPQHLITEKDWIIQGVQGELYPCKPDIFEATYEPVETVHHTGVSSVD